LHAGRMNAVSRKIVASILIAPCLGAMSGSLQDASSIRDRVMQLRAQDSRAMVTLIDGTVLQGRVIRVEENSFVLNEESTSKEVPVAFAQVKEMRKKGLAGRTIAVLIPAAIVGGALLVLCAAPYPIGFLCRQDPS
jgi:hypothetical protein